MTHEDLPSLRCRPCLQVLGGGTMKIRANDAAYLTHVDLPSLRCHPCLQVLGGGTMKIRTNDAAYLTHVDRWWGELLPRMTRLLYSNGGPIVMVQVLSLTSARSSWSRHVSGL